MKWRVLQARVVRVLFLLFCGLLILGQLQKIFLFPQISVYVHEVVLVCLTIVSLFGSAYELQQCCRRWKKPIQAGAIFLGWLIVGLIWQYIGGNQEVVVGVLYITRMSAYALLWPVLWIAVSRGWIQSKHVRLAVVSIGASIACLGLLQYVLLPDMRFLYVLGWDDHYYRVVSTLFDPSFTAVVLAITIVLLLISGISKQKTLLLLLTSFSFLLTYSRAGYVALGVGLLVCAWGQRKLLPIVFLGCLGTAILFLPRPASEGARLERTASVGARVESWQQAVFFQQWEQVVFGKGWYLAQADRTPVPGILASHSSSRENSWLQVLESAGVVGFGLFLHLLWRLYRAVPHPLGVLIIGGVLATSALFNNVLFYPWIMILWWMLYAAWTTAEK